ncbi:MAG: cyanophycin synthetase [Burkholderiaceae bacterium]|nr:MAG: cyanophycin synthetase [Burkholderiaceae bacterium]
MNKKRNIEFLRITHLRGPNIWTYRPVIEAWVDIGELEDFPSNKIPGLYERLTAWLPGLIEHRCGVGERGGFLQRLQEGTWAAHILEHVVLELQNMAGMRTGFGKARQTCDHGIYKVAFRTRQEQVGRAALHAGRTLLMAAIDDQPCDVAAMVQHLSEQVDALCLGPSTAHIVDAATERSIPFIRLNTGNLVQLGYGAQQRRIWTAETDRTSAIAEGISTDKDLTKSLLQSCGVPVPEGRIVDSVEDAWEAAEEIGLPVAVKPCDGNHGRGVSLDLTTRADIDAAYHLANRKGGGGVIVEQFIPGNEHRVLVVGTQVVAAARGETAWVTGDGVSTVQQLVDTQLNSDLRRGEGEEFPLGIIKPDIAAEIILDLERQGLTAQAVPAKDRRVLIQRNGNVAFDVTDQVHPTIAAAACLAARVVGLDIAGVDLVVEDISRPLTQQRGAIIEVNAGPGLLAHLKPAAGEPRNVGAAIVEHLFASKAAQPHSGRIPIVGITGTQGTALIAQLTAWLLHIDGKHAGLACGAGLYLNGRLVTAGDNSHWEAGQRLLINRNVQAAVFEHSARNILTEGLAYDRCQVGVVTDLQGHESLSEFYIREPEQMHQIVRTQIDVVLSEGMAVLNADDARVVELGELCDGAVIFYGRAHDNPVLLQHRAQQGRVVLLRDAQIVLAHGDKETVLLPLDKLKPAKAAQPEAVMAAVAAAWALDIAPELIAGGLRTFNSKPSPTPY